MAGEAHVSIIAVRTEWRRGGIGELLLVATLERVVELGVEKKLLRLHLDPARNDETSRREVSRLFADGELFFKRGNVILETSGMGIL